MFVKVPVNLASTVAHTVHSLNVEPSLVQQTALSPDEVEPPQVLPRSHESGLHREMLFQQVFSTPRGRSPISVTVAH